MLKLIFVVKNESTRTNRAYLENNNTPLIPAGSTGKADSPHLFNKARVILLESVQKIMPEVVFAENTPFLIIITFCACLYSVGNCPGM
jgi:hypothetical protein